MGLLPSVSNFLRIRFKILVAASVLAIVGSVSLAAETQRSASESAFRHARNAQEMLTAMLEQESGARGFQLARRDEFLVPYRSGRRRFERAAQAARTSAEGDDQVRTSLATQLAAARRWQAQAALAVAEFRRTGTEPDHSARLATRKRLFDAFRTVNAHYQRELGRQRKAQLRRAGYIPVAIILALGALFGSLAVLLLRRHRETEEQRDRRLDEYRRSQAEFTETMQLSESEPEAYDLIVRHVKRSIPSSRVTVLKRNNSEDRLEAATALVNGSTVAQGLQGAEPRSCLAVRLGREQWHGQGQDPLLSCAVCGKTPAATCEPLLVGSEVIGAVLVENGKPLDESERMRIRESVAQAAPVLANLRNLALAETRAATDVLTGLPNRRAVEDGLRRMLAQASRTGSPMAAVLLDLDHFKQINDTCGHPRGDDVLAGVGDLLSTTLRGSDFTGRTGGEEFVALLPDTDAEGAVEAAEKLRGAFERLEVPGVDRRITASFGVAVFPDDAVDADELLRRADRALYAAKRQGRNRVERTERSSEDAESPVESPALG
jgi:diguanylate cyclase (GGDEF)-like protein